MANKVIPVPKEIDRQIEFEILNAMNVKIDKLTNEQLRYMNSWN